MASDLAADHSGKMLGVSSRGVREIKMLQTEGFRPAGPTPPRRSPKNADQGLLPDPREKEPKKIGSAERPRPVPPKYRGASYARLRPAVMARFRRGETGMTL